MKCKRHPAIDAVQRCTGCQEAFCEDCLVNMNGRYYCGDCKIMAVPFLQEKDCTSPKLPCKEAGEALTLAIVFFAIFFLEPLAIKKALQAKKILNDNPNLTGRGKANTALIIAIFFFLYGLILVYSGLISKIS